MGKNHQHLKIVKSEKNKTHLKSSKAKKSDKHLPKGTNVTNTSFKIKQIVIRDQLKTHGTNELVTKRHLNINELLTRLQHYNTTVRTDGLSGIKELITSGADNVITQNLCNLVQNCGKLLLDRERSVRKEALKVIQLLLQNGDVSRVAPFFGTLVSFLCCAMTHINTNIQEDSLLVLDILLEHTSPLVAENFDKIMANFVNLMSKLKNDSKPGRTLTMNLGSKITSVKWRIKVLSRLKGMLEAVIAKLTESDKKRETCRPIVVHTDQGCRVPLFYNQHILQLCPFNVGSNLVVNAEQEEDSVIKYFTNFVPLLFETWLEVLPNKSLAECGEITISQETASTLSCTMNIFYLLWTYVKAVDSKKNCNALQQTFAKMCHKKFSNFILKQFPYAQQHDGFANKKKQRHSAGGNAAAALEVNRDPKCRRENLLICYMFTVFHRNLINDAQKENAAKVIEYLNHCLVNRNYVGNENERCALIVAREIIERNSVIWCRSNIKVESLLESLMIHESHADLHEDVTLELFDLICGIVEKDHLNRTTAFQVWLSKLPSLLLKPKVPVKIAETLLLLAKQNNSIFFKSFLRKMPEILDNVHAIEVTGSVRHNSMEILSIFYYLPPFFNEQREQFAKFFDQHDGTPIAKQLKQFIHYHDQRFAVCGQSV